MNKKPIMVSEYALSAWSTYLGSEVLAQLNHYDGDPNNDDYGIDQIHLFKLKNKKYAVIKESGCSCYDYSDATIEIFDKKKDALKNFNQKITK